MKAIIAMNRLGYVGLNGKLPWRSTKDFQHFKKLTLGCKLMVGRKTFESLPLLPNRELIVVGEGYLTLEKALEQKPDWVIGGPKLLESTLHLCEELHLSFINNGSLGDTKMFSLAKYKGKILTYTFETN